MLSRTSSISTSHHNPPGTSSQHPQQRALGILTRPLAPPCRAAANPHADRVRFTELDEDVVEVHPMHAAVEFVDDLTGVDGVIDARGDEVQADMDRDLPAVSMFGCDGFQCRSNP